MEEAFNEESMTNNQERCPGCGGLIAIIGTRHRCSGVLLGKAHDETTRVVAKPLPLNVRTTETVAKDVSKVRAVTQERAKIQERKPEPKKVAAAKAAKAKADAIPAKGRGRPKKPNALTVAQRVRRHRIRKTIPGRKP
jgi:hypothetical protein